MKKVHDDLELSDNSALQYLRGLYVLENPGLKPGQIHDFVARLRAQGCEAPGIAEMNGPDYDPSVRAKWN